MRILNLSLASILTGAAIATPATPDRPASTPALSGPDPAEIIATGFTEDGVPYNVTESFRKLTDEEVEELKASDSKGVTTSVNKRDEKTGSGGNCNQEYYSKYCFCSGAIAGKNEVWQSQSDLCRALNDASGINGHSEILRILWLPTMKIETRVRNWGDYVFWTPYDRCMDIFTELRDWCQWQWMIHKGGWFDRPRGHAARYEYDVNSR